MHVIISFVYICILVIFVNFDILENVYWYSCVDFFKNYSSMFKVSDFFYTTKGLKKYVHTLGLKVTNCYIFLRPVVDDVWIASQR